MRARSGISTRELVRIVLVVGVTAALLLAVFRFRFLLLVSLVGVIGGVLLIPCIDWCQRRGRLPRGAATALVVTALLALLGGGGYALWVAISGQVRRLAEQGPEIVRNFVESTQRLAERVPGGGFDLQRLQLGSALRQAGEGLVNALQLGVEGLAGVVVVLMIAIFVAANADGYERGALTLFPPRTRPRARELGAGCASVIRRWFTGQLLVMLITSTLTAIALWALGIDYWLVIAILTGLLDFIPFVGALLTGFLAVGVTLGTQPEKAGWVLLAYVAIQQVESNVAVPVVMKGRIQLPEAHLLVFVLLMGVPFGILGVFAAPPLFGVLHYLYHEVYVPWIGEGGREAGRRA